MRLRLLVTAGPHAGKEFAFERHDTFLVGRSADAHFQLSRDDPYFSRRHFLIEVNPPRIRVLDLGSSNGTLVNGRRVESAELRDGDEVKAGTTVFRVDAPSPGPDQQETLNLPAAEASLDLATEDYHPRGDTPVPGYELQDEIGRGGMGVVYRAVRQGDGHPVAIKTITPADGVGARQVERFLREARVLAGLSHPNIVGYHDSGASNAHVYLVMELVEGPDAGQLLRSRGPFPIPSAVRIACNLLSGLSHAHAQGFVHRDIKPSNLMIGGRPGLRAVKVTDFGLARVYDDCKLSGLTMQGEIGGTPAFMAPEQVTHYRDVKPAADQYAAAATLYNLLTGQCPHDLPKGPGAQIVHIINGTPVPILERRPDLPEGLAQVIGMALSREPEKRFSNVTALRTALLPFAS